MGVELQPKRLLKLPQMPKLPELLLSFIVLMVARLGFKGGSSITGALNDVDGPTFCAVVFYGYFFIQLINLLGVVTGDKSPIQTLLFSAFGFLFYLAAGSYTVNYARGFDAPLALGSMAIITSFVFATEAVFTMLNLNKGD